MTVPPMQSTDDRRRAIREILETERVASQAELLDHLGRKGFQTTQPVLSRDLRALKVAKRSGIYQLLEQEKITPLDALRSLLRGCVMAGGHLVVVRCEPGAASAIARALEGEGLTGIVGSVAGDDTVFVAVADPADGHAICARVDALL